MKRLLFIYSKMVIGGSTTSLLSILHGLDPAQYEVDLFLFWDGGAMDAYIPPYVNVIIGAKEGVQKTLFDIRRRTSPEYVVKYIASSIKSKSWGNSRIMGQVLGGVYPRFLPRIRQRYDVAVSFLEFGPCVYLARYVNAGRKIAWLHLDYTNAHLMPSYENRWFDKMDRIVLVSEICREGFLKLYPEQAEKAVAIENILSGQVLEARAREPLPDADKAMIDIDRDTIRLVSVSRIVFSHKGQDRVVRAIQRLVGEHVRLPFVWYVIGDGPDMPQLKSLVQQTGIEAYVRLLGAKDNPYPYLKHMHALVSASHYEGKPMAVTEAQILGLPVFTTRYSSADEQVADGFNGIIVDNSDDGVYNMLKSICIHAELVSKLGGHVLSRRYDNPDEMRKVIDLLEEKGEQGL